MTITLLTGGTGHLGRDLIQRLVARRRRVRVLARAPGNVAGVEWAKGDLATGAGIADALVGVDSVLHAATLSPIARRGSIRLIDFFKTPEKVDLDGTLRLLKAAERAKVKHFLYVSIVGLEHSPLPYSRVKLQGERLVRYSRLQWSVVRATPFYYLLERMLASLRWLPLWPLPDAPFDPVDTTDVATYLAECLDDGGRGMRQEIGGPETLRFVEFARQYQAARDLHRPILAFHPSAGRARRMGFVPAKGRRGKKTWTAWLSEHASDASLPGVHAHQMR